MKKILLVCFMCCLTFSQCVFANEETEDYVDMASSAVTDGDYTTARQYVNQALSIDPQDKSILDLKYTLDIVSNPNYIPYLRQTNPALNQAFNAKKSGNKDSETDILEQDANNGNFWSCYFVADLYRKNGNYHSAINFYRKAITLNSQYIQAYLGLGIAQYETGDYASAISSLQKYIELNPKSDIGYTMLAKCYLADGNANLALNYIEKALYISDNLENKLLQGEILYERGYYAQAKGILEGLKTNIQTADIYKYIGLCDYKLNNYTDALLNVDKAIILSDDAGNLNLLYNEIKEKIDKQNI